VPSTSERRALRGWGRATASVARVVTPARVEDVAAALRAHSARGALPRGLGRAYGDAAQNAGGDVLDMTALDGVRALDPVAGTATVGGGCSIAALAARALPAGWFPAVVPGTRWVTAGGAIAADVHGKNHHVDGGFAEHVERFTLVTPDGDAREVRPGDDAWRATVGGMGLTGAIVEATVRLVPVRSALVREEVVRAPDLDALLGALAATDSSHRYSVAWVDVTAHGRGLLMQGDHAADADGARAATLPAPRLRAPRAVPGGLLGGPAVRAFNALWAAVKPRARRSDVVPLATFFWPLDGVRGWNRLYGPRGLVQHQSVVPPGREDVLGAMLERLRRARIASPLAVLKRLGAGRTPLSFPREGWTLALDLPAGARGLDRLLDGFDELVAGAGGRVYLAKDARMRPDALAAMYPQLDEWQALRAALDPGGAMRSDLARRLELAA
jgi:decaprenylphospho-beta-D-ribofuranose 2-oxidase